jgi:hypothetical protein
MVSEDWAGIMSNIGGQVKTMLTQAGVRSGVCPLPATTLNIQQYTINLPPVPSILHWFASVSNLHVWLASCFYSIKLIICR